MTVCNKMHQTAPKLYTQKASNDELARKRRMISYPDGVTPDPLELLTKLQESRESPYWNRSLSDIGGMVLLKGAQAEIEKYEGQIQVNFTGEVEP